MRYKKFLKYTIVILSLILDCAKAQPIFFEIGKEHCAHCSMAIVDMRFHTQALTSKGRRYYFDSIECYQSYQKNHHLEIKNAWIANFLNPKEMLEEKKAIIIHSPKFRSPMGAGLAAFISTKDAEILTMEDQKK